MKKNPQIKQVIFLIGSETPCDLLLLSNIFPIPRDVNLTIGIQRDHLTIQKKIKKVLKALKNSGFKFVFLNILLNTSLFYLIFKVKKFNILNIKNIKLKYKLNMFFFSNINDANTIETIKKIQPDYIINHMPQILKKNVIKTPKNGIINIHPGILPKYQGMGSCLWPLIDNYMYQGSTLHYIDSESIDTGPIICVGRFKPKKGDSALLHQVKNRIIGAKMCHIVINMISNDIDLKSRLQINGKYHKLPSKSAIKRIVKNGYKLFSLFDGRKAELETKEFEILFQQDNENKKLPMSQSKDQNVVY